MAITIKQMKVKSPELNNSKFRLNDTLEISKKDHQALVKYCMERMKAAKSVQEAAIDRFKSIDKEISGFMILTDEDKKRKNDNAKGFGPKPYDINLQSVRTQMHEAITYLLSLYFPPEGAYTAIANKDKQDVAKGLSMLMNQHGQTYKHYVNTAKGLFDSLKYNLGLWSVEWVETRGTEIGNNSANQYQETPDALLSSGNRLRYLDPYNTYLDPSVSPTQVNELGEFYAEVEMHTRFRARRMQAMKAIYNLDRISNGITKTKYYNPKPDILGDTVKGSNQSMDWIAFLSANESSNVLLKDAIEFITINIWLPVNEFGIEFEHKGNKDKMGFQIWRIVIANAEVIVSAIPLTNAHGLLPILGTMPWDDNFGRQTQSFAEILLPYQRFSSYQMNIHQHAQRKALYGLTLYDSRVLPQLKEAEASGRIPFDSKLGADFDIRKLFLQVFDAPNTDNTLRDIQSMDDLMQKILPTQQAQQVASLERATKYQAAATVQSGNRRNLMIAITIDEQALMQGRKMQLYNILQYQESVEIFDNEGNVTEINPTALREQKFEFLIGSGLRGLDKLVIQETMKDILFALIQSPQASAQVDVVELMNYITTTMGDYTNLSQFKFKNEFDALPPEQKQMAFELLKSAMQQQAAPDTQA